MASDIFKNDIELSFIAAFKLIDKEGSGLISTEKLRQVMTTIGEKLSHEEVKELISHANVDDDGNINYMEFIRIVLAE